MSNSAFVRFVRKATSCVLSLVMLAGTVSPAFAAGDDWNSVIRPGINAGTGTADYYIDLFSPLYQDSNSMLFFNPKFRLNSGRDENEINVGLGYRTLISGGDWFLGGNIYFDTMDSQYSNRYNQIGLGVEARSDWLDVIVNGYIVIGDDINYIDEMNIYGYGMTTINVSKGAEQAMSGVDAEVGVLIPGISDVMETRAYLGGYWWFSDITDDPIGVKGRIEINPVPMLTINGMVNYDDVFEDVWRIEAYLNIPFSFTNLVSGENPFEGIEDYLAWGKGAPSASERMTDRVERDRYINTVSGNEESTTLMQAIYVDSSNSTGIEDGTLQHPYNTIGEAVDHISGDGPDGTDARLFDPVNTPAIYIFAGDGVYYEGNLGLLSGGNLDEDNVNFTIWGQGFHLPGLLPAVFPIVDATGYQDGFYVNGADMTTGLTFMGMQVQHASTNGLRAYWVTDLLLQNNIFANNGNDGAYLSSDTTSFMVLNNQFLYNGDDGLDLEDAAYDEGTTDLVVKNNLFQGNSGDGAEIYLYRSPGEGLSGSINALFQDNTWHMNGADGLDLYTENYGNGNTSVSIIGDQSTHNNDNNFEIDIYNYGEDGDVDFRMSGVSGSSSYSGDGLYLYVYNWEYAEGTSATDNTRVSITDSVFDFNMEDGAYVSLWNEGDADDTGSMNSMMSFLFSGNSASNNGEGWGRGLESWFGMEVDTYDGNATAQLDVDVTDNTANNNGGDNIKIYVGEDEFYSYANEGGNGNATTRTDINVSGNEANGSWNDDGVDVDVYTYATTTGTGNASNDATVAVKDNNASSNDDDNVTVDIYTTGNSYDTEAGGSASASADLDILDNTTNGSWSGDGIIAWMETTAFTQGFDTAEATSDIKVDGNESSNNAYDNIHVMLNNVAQTGEYGPADAAAKSTVIINGNTANGSFDGLGILLESGGESNDAYTFGGGDATAITNLSISGNDVNNNWDGNIFAAFGNNAGVHGETGDSNAAFTTNIIGNTANNAWDGDGIALEIYNNSDNSGQDGSATAKMDTTIDDNEANRNWGDNIVVYRHENIAFIGYTSSPGNATTTMDLSASGNTAEDSWSGRGINIGDNETGVWNYAITYGDGTATSDMTINVDDNMANGNYNDNIKIRANGCSYCHSGAIAGDTVVTANNNEASRSHTGDGIDVEVSGDGTNLDVTVDGNTADQNGDNTWDHGLEISVWNDNEDFGFIGDTTTSVTVSNNGPSFNYGDNIHVEVFHNTSGIATVDIMDNPDNNSSFMGSGISVETTNSGLRPMYVNIHGNEADNNYERGIFFENSYYSTGDVIVDIYDNVAERNYCSGGPLPFMAGIGVRNYGSSLAAFMHDNVANGNYMVGLGIWNEGSLYEAVIYDNQTDNNGWDGIGVGNYGGNIWDLTIMDNTAEANLYGVHVANMAEGVTIAYVMDNVVTESGLNGINVSDFFGEYMWAGLYGNEVSDNNYANGFATTGISMNTVYSNYFYGLLEGNTSTGNYVGVGLYGAMDVDLGDGPWGGVGQNSLYDNIALDLFNGTGGTVDALYNWWGADADPGAQIGGNTVNYTPWLASAP